MTEYNNQIMNNTFHIPICMPINESGVSKTCNKCGWIYKFCVCRRR